MTLFAVIVFIHLLASFGLFIGYGLEWTASTLLARAATSEQARAWLRVYRVSPTLSGPALGVLVLSGGYLASLMGAMKQGWILASLFGIVAAVLVGIVINVPRMRAIRNALPQGNESLSTAIRAQLSDPLLATSVRTRTMLAAGIVFLMVAKQPFRDSLIVLVSSATLGLVISVPALLRKQDVSPTI